MVQIIHPSLLRLALAACSSCLAVPSHAVDLWNQKTVPIAPFGTGVTVTVVDMFPPTDAHGRQMEIVIADKAPGATLVRWNWSMTPTQPVSITGQGVKVVNYSYGGFSPTDIQNPLNASLITAAKTGSAVVAKAAGNESSSASQAYSQSSSGYKGDAMNLAFANSKSGLIVGTLDANGSVSAPAKIGVLSNYAGSDKAVQARFLVANGSKSQYIDTFLQQIPIELYLKDLSVFYGPVVFAQLVTQLKPLIGKVPYTTLLSMIPNGEMFANDLNGHTSEATAIISGYSSTIGAKFKSATPEQVSNRLLNTARKDTLKDYKPEIYGQGEASLTRAIAPNKVR